MADHSFPPLEDLIKSIDHQLEMCPDAGSSDECKPESNNRRQTHKRRGNQFIRFTINQTQFALPLKYALEILPKPDITPLPNLPHWIPGICNVRGEIVSTVELCRLFHMKRTTISTGSHLVLLQIGQLKVGLLVDKIGGIFFDKDPDHTIKAKDLSDKSFAEFARSTFISKDYEVHLLEVSKLLPVLTAF